MPTIVKALALAELGIHVFPVNTSGGTKVPLTPRGHLDATTDPDRITAWWDEFPEASPGVAAGPSGLVLLDVDAKNGKDGWQSLMEAWVDIPDTLNYDTPTGGVHYVYESDRDDLNGVANYRKMDGVDRRAGSSFFVWWGGVPDDRDVFTQAPEWLLDPSRRRTERAFEGDTADWFESLTPGEPNVLVRRAMERVTEDMSHSEMVERQYEAVRLGAEGNPGVPQLLDAIQDAWLNRPPENHTTPESQWQYKFFESLDSGIAKYGELIGLVKSLPEFTPGMIPPGVSDSLIYGSPANKQVWNRAMRELITAESDDLIVVSILWSAPRPRDLSREWGLSFVMDRVTTERERMEAPDDVPVVAEPVEPGEGVQLLNEEEREAVARTQTFTDLYLAAGMRSGFANPTMFRASAWNVLSLAFAFKGFIPVSQTDKLGLNLWIVSLSYSGTGKAQPLHSQVLTPSGFKRMGDMCVGDTVVIPSGGVAQVAGVYPQGERPVYWVHLRGGRVVEADADHLWTVETIQGQKSVTRTLTTEELRADLKWKGGSAKWGIVNPEPADLGEWGSTIDPYSLGVLLGDGSFTGSGGRGIGFTCATDPELLDHLRTAVPSGVTVKCYDKNTGAYGITGDSYHYNPWLDETRRLGIQGLHSRDKHVPPHLLHSTVADRLALLQGLMDTDGTPTPSGADFLSGSKQLRDDVVWLVESLGGHASMSTRLVKLDSWDEPREYYRCFISLPEGVSPFRVPRKASKVTRPGRYARKVPITAIEFKGYEPTQCILVDHPDHEYVTDRFIRTHNTRAVKFEDEILNALYEGDNTDQPYQLGDQVSPAGLHEALLMRNRQGTYMNSDEASGFISRVENVEFMRGLKDDLAKYYDGYVPAATKKNAKHLKGESALAHFNMHLHATPERFWEIVTREMFLSGFLASVNWSIGELPDRDLSKVSLTQVVDVPDDIGQLHPNVAEIVTDLGLLRLARGASTPVLTSSEALDRMTTALRTMLGAVIGTPHEDMLEPAVTRLGFETIRKCATLNALWRGSNRVEHIDALVAIHAAQEWFDNLFTVAEQVSDSLFEKSCAEIEAFIRSKGGATRTQIFSRFKGTVQRTSREIDERLDMLRESGRIYRTERGGAVAYEVH